MKPPPRLRGDPSAAPELRADLERAATAPFPYDAAAGLAGLQAAIGSFGGAAAASAQPAAAAQAAAAETAAAAGAAPGAAAGKLVAVQAALGGTGGKLAAVAVVAAVVVGSVALWPARTSPTHPRTLPSAAAPRAPAAAPVLQPPASIGGASDRPLLPAPRAAKTEADAAPRAPSDPDAAMRLEIAELGRIRALLASDPAQAYRLASAGHRRFARGMLRQEREGLAILALWNMGRRGDAMRRSEQFLARYPRSPLRAEIEHELQLERRVHGRGE